MSKTLLREPAPPISDRVRFDDNFIDGKQVLCCPRCGGECMHQCAVTVYDRHEDAEYVTKTAIRCSDTCFKEPHSLTTVETERSSGSLNPSSRRHGLAILFFCKGCHGTSELTIAQDRGSTILGWRGSNS